jgi:hypothetical protein
MEVDILEVIGYPGADDGEASPNASVGTNHVPAGPLNVVQRTKYNVETFLQDGTIVVLLGFFVLLGPSRMFGRYWKKCNENITSLRGL